VVLDFMHRSSDNKHSDRYKKIQDTEIGSIKMDCSNAEAHNF
jgi:hypothetical protein